MKRFFLEIIKKQKVERVIKTFIEVFFSYIAVNVMTIDLCDKTAIYALVAGALGSSLSVLLNLGK